MEIRKATVNDLDGIMEIVAAGQKYFRDNDIDQWTNGYPSRELITEDISLGTSYVIVDGDKVAGTAMITFVKEEAYDKITDGKWITDTSEEYASVHRVGISPDYKGRGLAGMFIECAKELCLANNVHSIKIDTHEKNQSMKNAIAKHGFIYCGNIFYEFEGERIAFEKVV